MTTYSYLFICLFFGMIPGVSLMAITFLTKQGTLSRKTADSLYSMIVYSLMIISGLIIAYYNTQ